MDTNSTGDGRGNFGTSGGTTPIGKEDFNYEGIKQEDYEKKLKERQRKHLESIKGYRDWKPCMHDQCQDCHGTGRKVDGSSCIHMIACGCPRCTPYSMSVRYEGKIESGPNAEDPNPQFEPCHKVILIQADVPNLNGDVFSKAALDELASQNQNLLLEGNSLYGFVHVD